MTRTKTTDPRWTDEQIEIAARIRSSDVARALSLIAEGSRELLEMVNAATPPPRAGRDGVATKRTGINGSR